MTEDALLLFAVVCLCVTTALAYSDMQDQYNIVAAILHSASFDLLNGLLDRIPTMAKLQNAVSMLWWCVLFPVKMAFLFFFRRLILRWRNLYMWWWCAIVLTVSALAVSVTAIWLTCPYFTLQGMLCE